MGPKQLTLEDVAYLFASLPWWKLKIAALIVQWAAFERDFQYYFYTVPRATFRTFWRGMHPG